MTEAWVEYLTGPYGFIFAFAAGVLSFLSPCVLPLVPAYLAHLTGTTSMLSPNALRDQRAERRTTVMHAATFVLGFTAVFTIVGASVGLLGAIVSADSSYAIRDHLPLLGSGKPDYVAALALAKERARPEKVMTEGEAA